MNRWEFLRDYIAREIFRCDRIAESLAVSEDCKQRHAITREALRQVRLQMQTAEEHEQTTELLKARLQEKTIENLKEV